MFGEQYNLDCAMDTPICKLVANNYEDLVKSDASTHVLKKKLQHQQWVLTAAGYGYTLAEEKEGADSSSYLILLCVYYYYYYYYIYVYDCRCFLQRP
jgi:hypothetical protein